MVFCHELFRIDVLANIGSSHKLDPFGGHQIESSLYDPLIEFHVGDTVSQKATDPVRPFVDSDRVTYFVQLVCSGQACWSTADDCDALAGSFLGWVRSNPTFVKGLIDDGDFDILNRYRWIGDPQHTGAFAWCWTNPPRKLGEIICFMKSIHRFAPPTLINQIVPFRNQVVDGAAGCRLTKRYAAIHASSTLHSEQIFLGLCVDFVVIVQTYNRQSPLNLLAFKFLEPGWLSHNRIRYRVSD